MVIGVQILGPKDPGSTQQLRDFVQGTEVECCDENYSKALQRRYDKKSMLTAIMGIFDNADFY